MVLWCTSYNSVTLHYPLWQFQHNLSDSPYPADVVLLTGRAENIYQWDCLLISRFPAPPAPDWLMLMVVAQQTLGVQCTCNKEPAVTETSGLSPCVHPKGSSKSTSGCHYGVSIFMLVVKVLKHASNGPTSELVHCSWKSESKGLWTPRYNTDAHCSRCKKKKA